MKIKKRNLVTLRKDKESCLHLGARRIYLRETKQRKRDRRYTFYLQQKNLF